MHQARELVNHETGAVRGIECGTCKGQYRCAHFGKSHRPTGTVEEWLAEFSLQLAYLRAHAGLGHVDPVGCPGEVGLLGYRDEVLKLSEFHN